MPTPEDAAPRPMAAYGQSKFCAEAYLGLYERLYGMSTLTLRFGNVYGPRQDPHGEAGVIAIFCGACSCGERPEDVRRRRADARLHLRRRRRGAPTSPPPRTPRRAARSNVGTGVETRVLEVLGALREAAGVPEGDFEPEFAPARLGEMQRARSTSRARGRSWASRPTPASTTGSRRRSEWAREQLPAGA